MKKLTLLSLFLLSTLMIQAADKVIKLSAPNMGRKTSTVMQAFENRCSTRTYSTKMLSNADLSDLLWAANGVNRPDSGKRTAPSAMNKQDVMVYVVMQQGIYLYNASQHQLELVAQGDYRKAVAGQQDYVLQAPISILLVSDFAKFGLPVKPQSKMMGAMDAGIVSQNISLFCSAINLATVARASMDSDKLSKALKLNENQVLLMNHPVGYFK